MEVRVLRRLPAHRCSTARTSCWRSPAPSRSPISPRRHARPSTGPYDVSLVEGSVTTARDAERDPEIRRASRVLVTIGACADRRRHPGLAQLRRRRRSSPRWCTPAPTTSRPWPPRPPMADHVQVDFELRGCPINRVSCSRSITALLVGRGPPIPTHSVCIECKRRGNTCVMVAEGTPCLGPVTQAGCGAICPALSTAAATAASARWRTPNAGR